MKRVIVWIISVLLVFIMLTGCGGTVMPIDEDAEGKTILTVGVYDGGLGTEWLNKSAREFEELYKDEEFEPGKKGVKINVIGSKSYGGGELLDGAMTLDMYFTEMVSYFDHVNKGNFADISDIITSDLSEFGESGTIADKLDDMLKSYLTAKDGKYYALPFYDGFYGFIYDRDLFNNNYWFFDAEGKSA